MSQLVRSNDPVLRKKAESISEEEIKRGELKEIIGAMNAVTYGKRNDRKKPLLVGLAAPQIGISKKIIFVDIGADGKGKLAKLKTFINPEIVEQSDEKGEWYEGCWSVKGVCGIVKRAKKISIKAQNEHGKEIIETAEGYVARIFQHEIDHLSGILFYDHVTNPKDLHAVKEDEFEKYRNNEAWRRWKKLPVITK